MILRYRVSLAGLKGFARVYEVRSSMSLYDFHKRLRDDLEFPHDQLILFKALDSAGGVVGRYGMFDLGCGAVDEVTLARTVDSGVVSFVYFYDVTNRKSVIINLEAQGDPVPGMVYPALVETKGPVPAEFENGYVAYEDLPEDQKHHHVEPGWAKGKALPGDEDLDDEDFDDEEDDDEEPDDDEDGKEIFDENEAL